MTGRFVYLGEKPQAKPLTRFVTVVYQLNWF